MARSVYRSAVHGPDVARASRARGPIAPFAAALLLAACVHQAGAGGISITPFSRAAAGAPFPAPWVPVKINDRKIPTQYTLVDDAGTVVLQAQSDLAASMLGHAVNASVADTPWLHWRWKVAAPIPGADPAVAQKEDAPARVVLEFDGDRSKLPFSDRAVNQVSQNLSGRPLPYATLMYIFSPKLPVGTVLPNPHTRRIQMIVVDNGGGVGTWQTFTRNVRDDYKRAFNDEPQKLLSLGVLTDTDNTGEHAKAWYGDFSLTSER
jgi:hypothetical protein